MVVTPRVAAWWSFVPHLVDRLADAAWPGDVEVRFGPFIPGLSGELVTVRGDDGDADQSWATAGITSRGESGRAVVWVYVARPGLTSRETWCRVAELAQVAERVLRDDDGKPVLGGLADVGVWKVELAGVASDVEPATNQGGQVSGWWGWAKLSVSYEARV